MRTIDWKAAVSAAFIILLIGVADPIAEAAANTFGTAITFLQWSYS